LNLKIIQPWTRKFPSAGNSLKFYLKFQVQVLIWWPRIGTRRYITTTTTNWLVVVLVSMDLQQAFWTWSSVLSTSTRYPQRSL
jgi:hypothetical protein